MQVLEQVVNSAAGQLGKIQTETKIECGLKTSKWAVNYFYSSSSPWMVWRLRLKCFKEDGLLLVFLLECAELTLKAISQRDRKQRIRAFSS